MGISIWGYPYGDIHMGISIWGYPYGDPHVDPHGDSHGDSHRNPEGMGWEWEWKFPSHGNPGPLTGCDRFTCTARFRRLN